MVDGAKKILQSDGFDQMVKLLTIIQTILIAMIIPFMFSVSSTQSRMNAEFAEFRGELRAKMPEEFPPPRWKNKVESLEKEVNGLRSALEAHLAVCKLKNEK